MSTRVFRTHTIIPHGNHFFSSVASYRKHVLEQQDPHRVTYPSTTDNDTDMVIEGDVVFLMDVFGHEPSFPGPLNGLNVGSAAHFGVFKGISGLTVRIPMKTPKMYPALPEGTFYTTNYTERIIPIGTPLVLGEQPVTKKDSAPLVRSHTCSPKRIVACLKPFNPFRFETVIHGHQSFELLNSIYEVWEKIPNDDVISPPDAARSFFLFKASVACHFSHIREDVMAEYYKHRGAVPLRVKQNARRFYPNMLDADEALKHLRPSPINKEPCIFVDTTNPAVTMNNAMYWSLVLLRRHTDSLNPMSVVDESNLISPAEDEAMRNVIRENMTFMSVYAIQADIGREDVGNEVSTRAEQVPPIPSPVDIKAEFDWTAMRKICATSLSNQVPPGGQLRIRVWY